MEVVVITHKGGQRSDGSVSIQFSLIHTPHSTEKFNTNVKLPSCITCRCTLCLLVTFSRNLVSMQYRSSQRL